MFVVNGRLYKTSHCETLATERVQSSPTFLDYLIVEYLHSRGWKLWAQTIARSRKTTVKKVLKFLGGYTLTKAKLYFSEECPKGAEENVCDPEVAPNTQQEHQENVTENRPVSVKPPKRKIKIISSNESKKKAAVQVTPDDQQSTSNGENHFNEKCHPNGNSSDASMFHVTRSPSASMHQAESLGLKPKKKQKFENSLPFTVNHDEELGLTIRLCPGKGRRVFATKTFENSEPVVEYRGYLATPKKALNCKRENRFQPETDAFMFFFKWKGKEYCIDSSFEDERYFGRLLKHSRLNSNLRPQVVDFEGYPRIVFIAKRKIEAGEELLFEAS